MPYYLKNGQVVMNLTAENKGILDLLIKCCSEADDFVCQFLMTTVNENIAVGDYRLHRIEERGMDTQEFLELFSNGQLHALEELFMHPVKKQEMSLLTNKINSDKITPIILFNRHKEEPRAKLLRLLA